MRRLLLSAAALAFLATPALAQDSFKTGWYGTAGGAWVVPRDYEGNGAVEELKHDNGYGFYLGAGYSYGNGFRTEVEAAYGQFDHDLVRFRSPAATVQTNGSVDQYSLTGAVFYDFGSWVGLTPYAGAGAGILYTRDDRRAVTSGGNTIAAGDDGTDLTLFGEIGVSYRLTQQIDIVPAYRLQWINNGGNGTDDGNQHVARIGLRYWFN
jgi:opacity protein-like surface antigen